MKSKTKLVYSNYDPESGISIARIQTPHGTFKGKARVHPLEADIASSYAGCKYAEIRAYIKYYKFLAKLKQSSIEEITKIYNKLNQCKTIPDKATNWAEEQLNTLKKEKTDYLKIAKEYQEDMKDLINQRSEILKKINRAKNN